MTEPHKTTREVLDGIARERARLEAAVRSLGKGASTTQVTAEGWTAKDVLGHLIHWASQIAFALGAKLEPPSYVVNAKDRPSGDDEWNARATAHYGTGRSIRSRPSSITSLTRSSSRSASAAMTR